MSALHEAFTRARSEGRAALIGYLPAGFPTVQGSIDILRAMVANGVDIVEVGLPYSDPLMDGAVIQQAAEIALGNGTTPADVLAVVAGVAETGAPTLVMSYWNPIERFGVDEFAAQLGAAGGVGVITPDLTPEEAGAWVQATDRHSIDRIFLVAPSSTQARIDVVAGVTSGFVYAASTMGVTGMRTSLSGSAAQIVARIRARTDKPICVGVGVSTPEQAAEVAAFADGVIVGSAFVRAVLEAGDDAIEAAGSLARELAAGVRTVTPHT
jgi:tryptophan synthase alpha chain